MQTRPHTSDVRPRWWPGPSAAGAIASNGFTASFWNWDDDAPHETRGGCDPGGHTISIGFDRLETEFMLDGRSRFRGTFRSGMLAIIPAGVHPWAVQRGPARKMHLHLPQTLLALADGKTGHGAGSSAPTLTAAGVIEDAAATRLARRVAAELLQPGAGSQLLMDALGIEFAVHALRHWSERKKDGSPASSGGLGAVALGQVRDYLDAHLAENISLADLAARCGLSQPHFCRSFKAATGSPPHEFQLRLRVERAKRLLDVSDLSVGEVAAQVGYDDPSYFARLFRKQIGVTPKIYRQERK